MKTTADNNLDRANETFEQAVEYHLRRYFEAHEHTLPAAGLYRSLLREMERPLIRLCLERTKGNQLRAAALLGLNRNTLRKKIHDLNLLRE